jgi:hypothetical protein
MLPRSAAVLVSLTLCLSSEIALGQGRHERREARLAESARSRSMTGGVTFASSLAYAAAHDAALNFLKKDGYGIESADREAGQIVTSIEITGRFSQTGTRLQITIMKEPGDKSSIRVAVTQQKRKKLLQTEPWGDPKVNEAESSEVAEQLKQALGKTL